MHRNNFGVNEEINPVDDELVERRVEDTRDLDLKSRRIDRTNTHFLISSTLASSSLELQSISHI